jgi:hypothetical protein
LQKKERRSKEHSRIAPRKGVRTQQLLAAMNDAFFFSIEDMISAQQHYFNPLSVNIFIQNLKSKI